MRNRRNIITIRMDDTEYKLLKKRVKESGLTQQAFVINAIDGAAISSADEVETLKDLNRTLADLVRQLRGLATNVNQLAHTANGFHVLPAMDELTQIHNEVTTFKKECEKAWQSIRSSIKKQRPTGQ